MMQKYISCVFRSRIISNISMTTYDDNAIRPLGIMLPYMGAPYY